MAISNGFPRRFIGRGIAFGIRTCITLKRAGSTSLQNACRDADYRRTGRNIGNDHGAGATDCIVSYGDVRTHDGACTHEHALTKAYTSGKNSSRRDMAEIANDTIVLYDGSRVHDTMRPDPGPWMHYRVRGEKRTVPASHVRSDDCGGVDNGFPRSLDTLSETCTRRVRADSNMSQGPRGVPARLSGDRGRDVDPKEGCAELWGRIVEKREI